MGGRGWGGCWGGIGELREECLDEDPMRQWQLRVQNNKGISGRRNQRREMCKKTEREMQRRQKLQNQWQPQTEISTATAEKHNQVKNTPRQTSRWEKRGKKLKRRQNEFYTKTLGVNKCGWLTNKNGTKIGKERKDVQKGGHLKQAVGKI